MMGTYGGYEVVKELSRSPLGLRALARPTGGESAGAEFLLRVCFLDPIAERGQERVIVESFLGQVAIEQKAGGDHWLRVYEVGETDDGAFAVSDFYPRSARGLVDGKSRLDAVSLKQVLLGVVEGLIALRDNCGGRAHGMLRPEFVLINDSAGLGRWRVALCEPGLIGRGEDERKRSHEADLRGIAGIAIGLVEHKVPRSLNKRIEVTEAWTRVAGPRASSWVATLNQLLDPDLDCDRVTLESVRDGIAAIPARASGSKGKLIAVGAVGCVLLLGGGAVLGWKLLAPEPVVETLAPVATDFTMELWEEWVRADDWMRGLDGVLRDVAASEIDTDLRDELLRVCPKQADFGKWSPRDVVPSFAPPRAILMLEDESKQEGYFLEASTTRDRQGRGALEKANLAVPIARRIVNTVRQSEAVERYARLMNEIEATGSSGSLLEMIESARRSLVDLEVRSQDDIKEALRIAGAARLAEDAAGHIATLRTHLDGIAEQRAILAAEGYEDPVLAGAKDALLNTVLSVSGDSVGAVLSLAVSCGAEAAREAQTLLGVLRSAEFARVDLPTLREAIATRNLGSDVTMASMAQWRALASDRSLYRLEAGADPLGAWRGGRAEAALAMVDGTLRDLDSLRGDVEGEDRDRLVTSSAEFRTRRDAIAAEVERALRLAAIESTRDALVRERATLDQSIKGLQDAADGLYADLTISEEGLLDEIRAVLPVQVLSPIDAKWRERATVAEQRVRAAQGDRRTLFQIRKQWQAQQTHLLAVDRHFDVNGVVNRAAGSAVDPGPMNAAFMQVRLVEAQKFVDRVAWDNATAFSELIGTYEPLETLAAAIQSAMAEAVVVESQLDGWRVPSEIETLDRVLGRDFAGQGTMTAAYQESIAPVRARVEAAGRLAGTDVAALFAEAMNGSSRPEMRWASYVAADAAGTPEFIEQDLQVRQVLQAAIESSAGPAWRGSLESRLAEVSQSRWVAAMDAAASVDELLRVETLRDRVGAEESRLSMRARRHLLLVELDRDVRAVNRADPDAADVEMVRVVRAWVGRARASNLVGADAAWLGELEAALVDSARSGAEFDASKVGPATKGMQFVVGSSDVENFSTLVYSIGGTRTSEIVLRRVREEPFGDDVWFMAETEMTVGQFAALARAARREGQWTDDRQGSGPSGWRNDRGVIAREDWIEVSSPVFRTSSLFMPALQGRGTEIGTRGMSPHASMPLQQVNDVIVQQICDDVGLKLPPLEVWRAAVESEIGRAGVSGGAFDTSWVSPMGLNVRDEMWKNQREHEKNVSRGEREMTLWRAGRFDRRDDEVDAAWDGVNDGYLLFRYAADAGTSASGQFRHLIGNVAEVVSDGGQWAVVGGSAMSPPSMNPLEPVRLSNNRLEASADVGLRLAMSVPADSLRSTVVRRVERVVARSPYQWEP